jgi:hypothetical protein
MSGFMGVCRCTLQAARAAGVPVLAEGERLRPCLDELLALADYVTMSASFPKVRRRF